MPDYYGDWRAIHRRFFRWAKRGIWDRLLAAMIKEPDLETVMIDATIIRAHACSAGYGKDSQKEEALGRCVGGFATKISAMVDALGNPLKFILSPAQWHDIRLGLYLMEGITGAYVLADRYCDGLQ